MHPNIPRNIVTSDGYEVVTTKHCITIAHSIAEWSVAPSFYAFLTPDQEMVVILYICTRVSFFFDIVRSITERLFII
ncbi:hypothetical protein BRC72_03205 [Halobacteriales archaeon QH_7_66_36]|nr:MAG: hypothetical protein BRC72_03205 [Halobacteriales archaeon QH_7_66_36]